MPESHYALARGEPKRLKVDWGSHHARVFLDSNEIAQTGSDPPEYRLPDGSVIALFFDREGLDILRDGERLPGSQFEPQHRLLGAVATLLIIAAVHFVVWWMLRKQTLPRGFRLNQLADWLPAAGLAYLVLGVLVYYRSRAALWVAMAAWLVEASYLILVLSYYSRPGRGYRGLFILYGPLGLLFIADDALVQLKPRKRAAAGPEALL
jgi:hypothetical protein